MRKSTQILFRFESIIFVFLMMLVLSNCEEENETQNPVAEGVVIKPQSAQFSVGEQRDFSAFIITEMGDTLTIENSEIELRWWSSDTTVFTVEEGGMAIGKNSGEAYCVAEIVIPDDTRLKRRFVGRDSAFVSIF